MSDISKTPGYLQVLPIEERVARIEGKLGWRLRSVTMKKTLAPWAIVCLCGALICSVNGLGYPNHYYQVVLAILTVAVLYHRCFLASHSGKSFWVFALGNTLLFSCLYRLLIGSGQRFPFSWLKYPVVERGDKEGITVIPQLALRWEDSGMSQWMVDLTIVQTFLLLLTIGGAFFRFQPFASLTAIILVIVSIPALVGFNWDWVFPALVLSGVTLYFQSSDANER